MMETPPAGWTVEAALAAAHDELARTKARLELLSSATAVVVYERAPAPPFAPTYTSPNVVAQLGYQPQDFTSDPDFWASRLHPEDAPRALAALSRVFELGGLDCEYRFRSHDGSFRWLRDELRLVRAAGGDALVGTWVDITNRAAAETADQANADSLAVTLASIGGAVLATDATGRITRMNPVAEQLTGWSRAEARGRPLSEVYRIIDEVTREPALSAVDEVLTTEPAHDRTDQLALVARDGVEIAIVDSCAPLRDRTGAIAGALRIFRDVTGERRREEWHQTILDTAIDGFWVIDRGGRFLAVNPSYCRMSGYSRVELLRLHVADVEAIEDHEDVRRRIDKVIATGSDRFETRHRRKDGTSFDVQVSTQYSSWLGGTFVAFIQDITDRKRAEAELSELNQDLERIVAERTSELRQSEERIADALLYTQTLLDTAPVGIITYKASGEAVSANFASAQLIGATVEQLKAQNFRRLDSWRESGMLAAAEAALTSNAPRDVEISALSSFGKPLRIRSRFVPFVVSREQHLLALFEDVKDVRNAEDALRQSLLEKETLLKEIHHRVKNNLQIVASLLAMQSDATVEDETRATLRESMNRVRSMGLIHERLYQSSNLARIDFDEYLRSLTTFLYRSYSLTGAIRLVIEAEKVEVNIETAVPLGLILNELVSNAFKHAFKDGRPGVLRVTLRSAEVGFVLVVADSGPGLPAGIDAAHTKSLGLSLVSSLVRQLKAAMTIERAGGTSFRIELKELTYAPR